MIIIMIIIIIIQNRKKLSFFKLCFLNNSLNHMKLNKIITKMLKNIKIEI